MSKRNSSRKANKTSFSKRRKPDLLIFTNGKKTEVNYIKGLHQITSENNRKSVIIKTADTNKLIERIIEESDRYVNNPEKWIVLDRDKVTNFDELIKKANENNIKVAWSNPCIEEWFSYYFEVKIMKNEAQAVIHDFKNEFLKRTGFDYEKNEENIYTLLKQFGNEEAAIKEAVRFLEESQKNNLMPSNQLGCTTMHLLVKRFNKD